jgi:hypothetical protein
MNQRIKWAAKLSGVREVSLLGTADLAFWRNHLRPQLLVPAEHDGQAQLMIIASDARFRGTPFRELSFCVSVSPLEGISGGNGAYLLHAFNSCRFFAFCERTFFSAPYDHGQIRVSVSAPAAIQLLKDGEVLFEAHMSADVSSPTRAPLRHGEDAWQGPVFLPANPRRKNAQLKLFCARISGHTAVYPFLPSEDALTIEPLQNFDILQALIDSNFVAREWVLRGDARHAKSKTYNRAAVVYLAHAESVP